MEDLEGFETEQTDGQKSEQVLGWKDLNAETDVPPLSLFCYSHFQKLLAFLKKKRRHFLEIISSGKIF